MKKKILYVISVLILLMLIIMGIVNNQPEKKLSKTYFYLGTIIDITIFESNDEQILKEVSDLILKYDNLLSRTISSSEIAKLNESKGPSQVSDETYHLIKKSMEYSQTTNGYFDISINPIVELWGIGTEEANIPTDEDISEALNSVDYNNIILSDNQTVELINNTSIDLGGIAKGFIADEIATLLKENDINKALINIGGNVMALGTSTDDKPWKIGIRHPVKDRSDVLLKIELENKSVVTSGIYERFFESNNHIYHHIFDPFTGYPMDNELMSLTVVSEQSIDGDALSTGLFNLGLDKAFEKANELGIDIIIVTKNEEIYISKNINDVVTVFDETYELKIKE